MKRHQVDPQNFSLLNSLDDFARLHGLSISDPATQDKLFDSLRSNLRDHVDHKARIHGLHVQSMFAHVAAAMGACKLITEEDAGAFFHVDDTLRRPDFRIITADAKQMLVEVKNLYQKKAFEPYLLKRDYLESLRRYARLSNLPLRIAIYWARWNIWTLSDADRFDSSRERVEVSLNDAYMHNEIYLLGDSMIGTRPPLSVRVYADKSKPRTVAPDGRCCFTTVKLCLCSEGIDIDDPVERRLAWFLIMNGTWDRTENYAHVVDGLAEYFELRFFPKVEPDTSEETSFPPSIGCLSQMISAQYLRSTSHTGEITNLTPKPQPDHFGILIPENYAGRVLKLWRFTMLPKHVNPTEALVIHRD